MIDRLAEQAKKEKAVVDYLDNQDNRVDTNIDTTAENLGVARDALGGTVTDLMGGAVSKYGLDPSIAKTGMEGSALADTKLARQQDEMLSSRKLNEKRTNLNRFYQFALDKAQAAGMSLKESDAFAREWALTQVGQDWQAGEAEKNRGFATDKNNIATKYNEIMAGITPDEGDPYHEAMVRSLLGLGGAVGTGYALGAFKKKPQVTIKTDSAFSTPVAGTGDTSMYDTYYSNPSKTAGINGYGG